MEGWTSIMYIYQDVYSEGVVIGYFVICIVICSFLLLNLTIAVMLSKYEELQQDEKRQEKQKKKNKDKKGGQTKKRKNGKRTLEEKKQDMTETQLELFELAQTAKMPRKLFDFLRTSNSDLQVSQEAIHIIKSAQGQDTHLQKLFKI